MKKSMKLWQLIVGCILCVGIFSSMFFPRITISADRIMDFCIDAMETVQKEYKDEVSELIGSDGAEDMQEQIDEIKEYRNSSEFKKEFEEQFGYKNLTCSSANIMFVSKEGVKDFITEMLGDKEIDGLDKIASEVHKGLFWIRMILFAVYFLPIILLLGYILSYWKGWKNTFAVISTWVYLMIATLSIILWFILIPSIGADKLSDGIGKAGSGLGSLFGFGLSAIQDKISDLLQPVLRSAIIHFTGVGVWLFIIFSIALLVFSVLLLLFGQRKVEHQSFDMWPEEEAVDNISMGEDMEIPQDIYPIKQGCIRVTKGSMNGAVIPCPSGEQFVVGRDPEISNLILSHPKVSRKHFVIQFMEEENCYQIYCFSKNGIHLFGGGKIEQSQTASISRGTKLILADGAEEIVLE